MIINVINEAKSREAVGCEEKGQCANGNNLVIPSNCTDESSSRSQEGMQIESQLEQYEVNTLTIDWVHKAVTCEVPRLQLHIPTMQKTRGTDRSFIQHNVWETDSGMDN